MLLLLYVDDMLIIGDDQERIQSLQIFLRSKFDVRDLGWVLCILLGHRSCIISSGLSSFSDEVYWRHSSESRTHDSKTVGILLEPNQKLLSSDGTPFYTSLAIGILKKALSTWASLSPILPFLFKWLISLSPHLHPYIRLLFFTFCSIFKELWLKTLLLSSHRSL